MDSTEHAGIAGLDIPRDARYVDGHFPGDPLVPGAKLIDLVLAELMAAGAIGAHPIEVTAAKFIAPVRPGDHVTIGWRPGSGGLRFECRVGDTLVATGAVRG
jgi:3-hydroxymyristoyl/3-hydroxydecanoyl-(acyl carrier protein) dehydratase